MLTQVRLGSRRTWIVIIVKYSIFLSYLMIEVERLSETAILRFKQKFRERWLYMIINLMLYYILFMICIILYDVISKKKKNGRY